MASTACRITCHPNWGVSCCTCLSCAAAKFLATDSAVQAMHTHSRPPRVRFCPNPCNSSVPGSKPVCMRHAERLHTQQQCCCNCTHSMPHSSSSQHVCLSTSHHMVCALCLRLRSNSCGRGTECGVCATDAVSAQRVSQPIWLLQPQIAVDTAAVMPQ